MARLSPLLTSALAQLADQPCILVASDFDGVLAPLVLDPTTSRALPGTIEALETLAAMPGTHAAVVSGRDLETLTSLTGLAGSSVTRIGSHGAQTSGAGPATLDHGQRTTLDAVVADLEELLPAHPGASLEHKPTAVVLHTRRIGDGAAARAAEQAALEVTTRHTDLNVLHGKHVVEVGVVEADKGSALVALRDAVGATAVAYFGDDVTDEHAFARLGEDDVAVKVGPGETAARYRVDSPEDVAAALTLLVERRRRR